MSFDPDSTALLQRLIIHPNLEIYISILKCRKSRYKCDKKDEASVRANGFY